MINFDPFPEHLAAPKFVHALHIPGLELTRDNTEIAGLVLRRLRWVEWMILEHGATAEALQLEFEQGLHSFVLIDRKEFAGDSDAAEALANCDVAMLRRIVSALRLVKAGILLDPEGSMRYQRLSSLNIRTPGVFGRLLFEPKYSRTYVLSETDAAAAEEIVADLAHPTVAGDRTIQLAIRHFEASYDHTLDDEDRLLHLFTALEATFAEYKTHTRPVPGASLGESAATLWPTATREGVARFLDEKSEARGLRNAVAHGNLGGRTPAQVNTDVERLREILRLGLRMLVRLTSRRNGLITALENVSTGLGALPPKATFQHLLGHAAKGSVEAKKLLTILSV
jgi:hypothetical protein